MRPTHPLRRLAIIFAVLAALPAGQGRAVETRSELEKSDQGWTDLLAGADSKLKGWTRLPIPAKARLKSEQTSQWSIDPKTGYLVCEGDGGHEWLRWDQEVGDAIYHVEWRFTPGEGKKGYNSGIYVRNSADATVWHQAQTGSASGGFLFGETLADGKLKRFDRSKQVPGKPVKPAGEWNTFEITCKGPEISLWVNGETTSVLTDCGAPSGYVGLEAEGYRIEFRNVKLKRLTP